MTFLPKPPFLTEFSTTAGKNEPERLSQLAEDHFQSHCQEVWLRTDRMFAGLMAIQWLAGIGVALWISPRTWIGATSSIHLHVLAAIFLGGAIAAFPLLLIFLRPGQAATRQVIAVSQILFSALLIHLTGGRIETHFHVFGSLAFLAFYRDWRVLVTASVVVAVDHFLRGTFWPQSVFGTVTPDSFRWIEHAGWVVFEDVFLFIMCHQSIQEMRGIALRQAELEMTNDRIEQAVFERTGELAQANHQLRLAKEAADAANMTKEKEAQEQIAAQAALLDKAQDAILVADLDGKTLYWNKGAERIYGWTSEEALGKKISDLIYMAPDKLQNYLQVALEKGEFSDEVEQVTKDRHKLTVEARRTLIRDQEGNPKSILSINTDITEKKKIEAQFLRAQRMESIGTLAGGIAHDLNNILAPIMMSIDILKATNDTPQTTKILETIAVSAKRGSDIVRQVLSFARGLEGERVEVQPKHLLKEIQNIIKETFPRDIEMLFVIPKDPWTILGDPTQMHQILLNLCVNARDAMPDGGTLTVDVQNCALDEHCAVMDASTKAGRYVKISVTDSGMGMPPGIVDRIFEPFFTTKALHKGTGLGLSTVLAIVKSHEGIINVYSEPGKGTTFTVYLPAMEMSLAARMEQTQPMGVLRGHGEVILIVDDETSILSITRQTLEAFGYRVLTAKNGEEAVATYAQHREEIAVVLTDMMMPVMNGAATIHALMRINPAIKIVAASGLNSNEGVANVTRAGVKHFLTKPYTARALLRTMQTVLEEVGGTKSSIPREH